MTTRPIFLSLLLCLLVVVVASSSARVMESDNRMFTGGPSWGQTREEILHNRERRKRQMRNMVRSLRKRLADHSAGEITLGEQEKRDMERRLSLFQQKADMMEEELDERDIERILVRNREQDKRKEQYASSKGQSAKAHDEL